MDRNKSLRVPRRCIGHRDNSRPLFTIESGIGSRVRLTLGPAPFVDAAFAPVPCCLGPSPHPGMSFMHGLGIEPVLAFQLAEPVQPRLLQLAARDGGLHGTARFTLCRQSENRHSAASAPMSPNTSAMPSAASVSCNSRIPGVSISHRPPWSDAARGPSWCAAPWRHPRGCPASGPPRRSGRSATWSCPHPKTRQGPAFAPPTQAFSRATSSASRASSASAVTRGDSRWASRTNRPGSGTPSALVITTRGSAPAPSATARYRSIRAGLKSALQLVTMASVSTFAAINCRSATTPAARGRFRRAASGRRGRSARPVASPPSRPRQRLCRFLGVTRASPSGDSSVSISRATAETRAGVKSSWPAA